jgi:hypothetical protein
MLLSLLTVADCGSAQQTLGNGTVSLIPNVQVGLSSWSGKCLYVIVSLFSPFFIVYYKCPTVETSTCINMFDNLVCPEIWLLHVMYQRLSC